MEEKTPFIEYAQENFHFLVSDYRLSCEVKPSIGDYATSIIYKNENVEIRLSFVGFRNEGNIIITFLKEGLDLDLHTVLWAIALNEMSVIQKNMPEKDTEEKFAIYPYKLCAKGLEQLGRQLLTDGPKMLVEIAKKVLAQEIAKDGAYFKLLLDNTIDIKHFEPEYSLEKELQKTW